MRVRMFVSEVRVATGSKVRSAWSPSSSLRGDRRGFVCLHGLGNHLRHRDHHHHRLVHCDLPKMIEERSVNKIDFFRLGVYQM